MEEITDIQVQENQTPSKINPKNIIPRHTIMLKARDKQKILRATRGKMTHSIQGNSIRLPVYFSAENFQTRREWNDTFKVLKEKLPNQKSIIEKLPFRSEGETNKSCDFPDGSAVKNLPVNAEDADSIPGEGNGNSLQCPCLGNPMEKEVWLATVHGVPKESDMT